MEYMITFRSITPAQRAENVLRQIGMGIRIQRTPRWMEEKGCGYCLHIKGNAIHTAVEHLHEAGILYRKVYLLRNNGTTEELEV